MSQGPEPLSVAPPATFQIQTATRASAVAVIEIQSDTLDAWLAAAGLQPVAAGRVQLCNLWNIDRGLVARWSASCLHLMPHGGRAILEDLGAKLVALGAAEVSASHAAASFPEGDDEVERRMLQALARAASPRAVDLLLDQPDLWRRAGLESRSDTPRDAALRRLITPALVAAWGRPNIGKSTLVNALAQRDVAIVADMPGTTRDHVGVSLELDGLALRYVDTPGVTGGTKSEPLGALAARAHDLARIAVQSSDLVLHCGDAEHPPPPLPAGLTNQSTLRVALRSDMGRAEWPHDLSVCATTGQGLAELAVRIRQCLVPDAGLRDPSPWKFWV